MAGSLDFRHGQRRASHVLRASELKITKKMKKKKPCSELKNTNMNWRPNDASRLVLAPTEVNTDKIQVSPSSVIIPDKERINLQASLGGI